MVLQRCVVMQDFIVKENVSWVSRSQTPLSTWWVCGALALTTLAFAGVALIDTALPDPHTREHALHHPNHFIAEIAYEHLLNLTAIGPRVAGSYENEVWAVQVLVSAVRQIANLASPHNRVEVEVHSAEGAFPIDFLDGMNNVYRGVQMVVVRVSAVGDRRVAASASSRRSALLLNCHYDTVPDSPGASDDAAGCAVLLETVRALVVRSQPLRHDLILLMNGAEENILQASHAFITTHRWARSVRAFINIEACGAGGREVLFQAGPHDPWITEVYASVVPHPFASSLAQELFQSGLIPAETDYRIFRDFGNLSGVDLAWSANGYVYHTHLDTADKVPVSTLQRTGDNVLALTQGLLQSEDMEKESDPTSRQPVFFDVLGVIVVSARAPLAVLATLATVALVLLDLHLAALHAKKELYVVYWWWWGVVFKTAGKWVIAMLQGVLAATAVAIVLHVAGARITFYSRGWLLGPLYAAPALAAAWSFAIRNIGVGSSGSEWRLGGWRGALAWRQAGTVWAAVALSGCAAVGLRSGFLPLMQAFCLAVAGVAHAATGTRGSRLPVYWTVASILPTLQTCYLSIGLLRMLVPVMGRAGSGPVPADVIMSVVVSVLVLSACNWMLPLVLAAKYSQRLTRTMWCLCFAGFLVAVTSHHSASYSPEQPQRLMMFHVRREVYPRSGNVTAQQFFWVPQLDANTGATVRGLRAKHVDEARSVRDEECTAWTYCGVPYYLPVLSLIPSSYMIPTETAPISTLHVQATTNKIDETTHMLQLNITGPSHVVVIVSPVPGVEVSWSSVVEQPRPTRPLPYTKRSTYFLTLHEARAQAPHVWNVTLHLRHSFASAAGTNGWADVSVAGHSMFGENKMNEEHKELVSRLPAWVTHSGWSVHMQLLQL